MRENSCYRINYAKKRLEVRQAHKHEASFFWELSRKEPCLLWVRDSGLLLESLRNHIQQIPIRDSLPSSMLLFCKRWNLQRFPFFFRKCSSAKYFAISIHFNAFRKKLVQALKGCRSSSMRLAPSLYKLLMYAYFTHLLLF